MMVEEAALYPVPSLCPTQRDCYGLMRYHGAAESQTPEGCGCFLLIADNSSDLVTVMYSFLVTVGFKVKIIQADTVLRLNTWGLDGV